MTRKPRFLFVLSEMLGWQTYADQLTRVAAARNDVDVDVIRYRVPRLLGAVSKRSYPAFYGRRILFDPISVADFALARPWRDALARGPVDAIHVASQTLLQPASSVAGPVPVSVALDCTRQRYNDNLRQDAWSRVEIRREAALLGGASRLYPMSRWAATSLGADYGIEDGRISVMPPSTLLGRYRPRARRDWGRARVLFVGNNFAAKGGDRLTSWMTGPLRELCELHVVSGDPHAQVRRDGVVVHGSMDNDRLVGEVLPRVDLLCLPTRLDLSPNVLVEAAAAGLPAIASDVGAISELVRHGETGYLVDPDDQDGFVARLRELAGDPAAGLAMGSRARELAAAAFSAEINYNRLIDEMKSMAGVDSGPGNGLAPPLSAS
jgi:glycosyltransferase involved in cell wall biosynthesis